MYFGLCRIGSLSQLLRDYFGIVYFDVKSDELKEFPRPDFIGGNQLYRLTSLKGCVGLYGGNYYSKTLDIWIMEKDE